MANKYTVEMNDDGSYDVGVWTKRGFEVDDSADCNLGYIAACHKMDDYNAALQRSYDDERVEAKLLSGNMYEPIEVE